MKKLILLLTLLVTVIFITACDFKISLKPQNPSNDGTTPGDETPPEEFTVYSSEVKVSLIVGEDKATDDDVRGYNTLRNAISELLPGGFFIKSDVYARSEENPSEIVVGHTSRKISNLAYKYLSDKGTLPEGYSHFVIYCYEGAVAIAADGKYAMDAAIDYFLDDIVSGETELILDYDFVDYVTVSIVSHEAKVNAKLDAEEEAALLLRWTALEEKIGKDAADAVKKLYDYYGKDWLTWLANLYDPETGCFYYANSARDNEGFLVDCESTEQALSMLLQLGLFRHFNNSWQEALPADMRAKCLAYIQDMQSEDDGYFYHPQWGTAIGDSRKGRDLSSCLSLIRRMGGTPLYRTPAERIASGTASPVSLVITAFMAGDEHKSSVILSDSALPSHLQSPQALIDYIDSLNVRNNFYSIGHILSSQTSQIKAAGLGDACLDYIDTFQSPVTGFWDEGVEDDYDKISAITKLGALYGGLGRRMKYMDKIIDSAMDIISSETVPGYTYVIFNAWGGLEAAVGNVAATSDPDATDNTNIEVVRAEIYRRLPEMIDATITKLSGFKHADGSFSTEPGRSAPTTQGVSVSLGLAEGDVNGTVCAMSYLLGGLFGSIGVSEIPMLTYKDYREFFEIINNIAPIEKQ